MLNICAPKTTKKIFSFFRCHYNSFLYYFQFKFKTQIPQFKTQNSELKIQNSKSKNQNLKIKFLNRKTKTNRIKTIPYYFDTLILNFNEIIGLISFKCFIINLSNWMFSKIRNKIYC